MGTNFTLINDMKILDICQLFPWVLDIIKISKSTVDY
ncbi:hypothetical protein ABIB39_004440 [Mucilaginibacter sp. UYP27]